MDCSLPGSVHGNSSRQEYWSGLLCPSPRDLPDPGDGTSSLTSPALAGMFFTTSATWNWPDYLSVNDWTKISLRLGTNMSSNFAKELCLVLGEYL